MLYIHIPFCDSKCGYCGFYSVVSKAHREAYLDSVLNEARSRAAHDDVYGRSGVHKELSTIYIGGGSPSVFSAGQWVDFFRELSMIFPVEQAKEITLEVNPEHLSRDNSFIKVIAEQTPITRISMGVQSFDDNDLLFLGRKHSRKEIFNAIESVNGLELSIDLIYGISSKSWLKNLDEISRLNINHFSAYSLTIEPNTIFSKKKILENETLAEKNYFELQQWCKENNFEKYETSNYARDNKYSLHNCNYWRLVPYIGLGAGAHSYSGFQKPFSVRKWNLCNVANYVSWWALPQSIVNCQLSIVNGAQGTQIISEEEFLSEEATMGEYAMTSLRTKWGMQKSILKQFSSAVRQKAERILSQEKLKGNIIETETSFLLTNQAQLFADKISVEFFFGV
jgi:oxygen-independent coproporphyrinogen-3 oxidase